MKRFWRKKVTHYPSQIVHAARIIDQRLVPVCQPSSQKAWHQMPDNMSTTCKTCQRLISRLEYDPLTGVAGIKELDKEKET